MQIENNQNQLITQRGDIQPVQEQYYTNINELIAEPQQPSKTQIFLNSLFNLSLYLFTKKTNQVIEEEEVSFDGYLNSVGDEITRYENLNKKSKEILQKVAKLGGAMNQSQLIECYNRVPYIFFQENFVLDFGDLSKQNRDAKSKQESLNEDLDLVQINLFTQIHYKFHDYFAAVNNFDYLSQSIVVNIQKIQESRRRMGKVKSQFVEKSARLRKMIVQKQNLQKAIKIMKIAKSLQKLPTIINEILASSLPYQCLSLLKSTKQSLTEVQGLKCLSKTSQHINQSQNLVQLGLNKRYVDELYLYLEQCQQINLSESWQRINSQNCMDISGMNNSMMGSSTILEQSFLDMQPNCTKNKRNEGKQFQIAMIVIQSYKYIDFPQDLTRIKISNSLRVFLKKFDQELVKCLRGIMQNKIKNIDANNSAIDALESELNTPIEQEDYVLNQQLVQKVTVMFYVKHIYFMNQIMKETLNRLLGFLQTLLSEYEDSEDKDEERFLSFFREELTSFSAITKIALEKIKSLMLLKNINGIGLQQFKQWIALLEYWQKYAENLIEEHPLINYQGSNQKIQQVINESLRKMIQIMNIKSIVNELSFNFVTSYHANVVNSELHSSLTDQSWQSVQIPAGFIQILNNISSWNDSNLSQNISITILNDSGELNTSNRSLSMSTSQDMGKKTSNKFRILKNNILVDGNRYKVSVSFLFLCEFIDEYIKMAKSLSCPKFVYERMFDLIDSYNNKTRELILEAQARKYQKMKNKNISAKHLCLVHNCLTLLQKLLNQMKKPDLDELRDICVTTIEIHRKKILDKLQSLLRAKIESTINGFFQNKDAKTSQTNLTILNTMVQMMGIVDEYLQFEERKQIFRYSINLFVTKYFKELLLKGEELLNDNKILLQKLTFLKQYFPDQLELMDRELAKIEKS